MKLFIHIFILILLTGCGLTKEELFKQAQREQERLQAIHQERLSRFANACQSNFGFIPRTDAFKNCVRSFYQQAIDIDYAQQAATTAQQYAAEAEALRNMNNSIRRLGAAARALRTPRTTACSSVVGPGGTINTACY